MYHISTQQADLCPTICLGLLVTWLTGAALLAPEHARADEPRQSAADVADALVAAEREFLAAQSDSIFDGTYTGDFGVRMRKIIAAEYRMLEQRRELARKQNLTAAVAVVGLLVALIEIPLRRKGRRVADVPPVLPVMPLAPPPVEHAEVEPAVGGRLHPGWGGSVANEAQGLGGRC